MAEAGDSDRGETTVGKGMRLAPALALSALAVALPASASASTVLGQAPPTAGAPGTCAASIENSSVVQKTSTGNGYAVPSGGGVLTEWRHAANFESGQTLRLRVFVAGAADTFTAVAESQTETLTPNVVNSFPTRIPVSGGELIGLNSGPPGQSGTACVYNSTGNGFDQAFYSGDMVSPPLGTPATYLALKGYLVDIAAVLEPDADRDGFGDETQDQCPTDASTQGDCAPPDTSIASGPKDKTKKKTATFEFSSNEPGSTFECSLDGGAFAPCTSPHTLKVKKGKHSFAVRAKDAAGNVDGSPATDDWKVKKKKKKKKK